MHFMIVVQTTTSTTEEALKDPDIWVWSNETPTNGGFTLLNKKPYLMILEGQGKWKHLNTRWHWSDIEKTWTTQWIDLAVRPHEEGKTLHVAHHHE